MIESALPSGASARGRRRRLVLTFIPAFYSSSVYALRRIHIDAGIFNRSIFLAAITSMVMRLSTSVLTEEPFRLARAAVGLERQRFAQSEAQRPRHRQ